MGAKRWAAGLGVAAAGLAAVLVVRTLTWTPPARTEPVPLAPPTEIDGERAAARLGQAIRFQTVSNQDPAENRWEAWTALHDWMAETYPAVHRTLSRQVLAGRTLVYRWEGTDPAAAPIVLMAHQDVVPVTPGTEGDWRRPPFSGEIAQGYVFGRGALDDKGSLVAILEAVEALAARGFRPARTVWLVFGHDEEVGGTGAAAAARLIAAAGPKPEFVLDEGGLALKRNPVTGSPFAFVGVAEKGSATLRVTARGEGGHSSTPPKETAVHVLAKAVDRIASRPRPMRFEGAGADTFRILTADAPFLTRLIVANDWLFGPLIVARMADDPGAAAMLHTTTAPTMLQGSPKENVLPQTATALINYRLHPRDTRAEVMAHARRSVGDLPVTLTWEAGAGEASPVSSTDSRAWRLIATLSEETLGMPATPYLLSGATDARMFTGVAEDVYRFMPAVVDEEDLAGFHGSNERLSVASLERMAEFYARLVATAAGPDSPPSREAR